MAGRALRALFSTNDRNMAASEAFTDRHGQWRLVQDALAEHLARVTAPGFDVEDLEAPRTNIQVFFGVGGIGKTTLSRTLETALSSPDGRPARWGEPSWPARPTLLPVRIDLARSAGTDFERVLLTIRVALASHLGRPLPAFDIALRRYWEHQHPGESLEEYLTRGGLTSRFGKALPQQVQSALGDVAQTLMLPGTVGGPIGQLTGTLAQALRERRQTVRALAGCARLADLLEVEPDVDALSYYPHLLAWELAQLPADKQVVPVIMLDTFEDTGTRTHRDLERLLQRLVWLMPNTFFIVTGRGRLQWADSALEGQLDFTGPTAWPGLTEHAVPASRTASAAAAVAGRQVLIGDFSPEDCDDYLARRLVKDGQPLITPELRAVITARSHGLPLYLDLAVLRFLELRRTGRTPVPADFDADFPALITRTLADLTPDERHILRSVSLLDAFDLTLATKTAGLAHQAPAARLVERPFVRAMPHTLRAIDGEDESIAELEMIVGFDDDLACEATRVANRIHGLLTQIHPSLERVLGPRLQHPAVPTLLERFGSPAQIRGRRRLVALLRPKAPRMAERLHRLGRTDRRRPGHRGSRSDRPEPRRVTDGRA